MRIKSYKGEYEVKFVDDFFPEDATSKDFIFIDEYVWQHYLSKQDVSNLNILIIPSNEYTKTFVKVGDYITTLLARGVQKNSKFYCIGGGVVQDTFSFIASILFRGVDWIFYPTTMLAQCDSCIGSKTSINFKETKNILGGFHPAKEVRINTQYLQTLPDEEIKSGIGEMLHYFLLNDKLDLSEKMVNEKDLKNNIDKYIHESLAIKKEMIEKDEFDMGERNLFNYGHTFGHAIESLSQYEVNHGQAVTMGMEISNQLALSKGYITEEKYQRLRSILAKNMPEYSIEDIDRYVEILHKDKKNTSDKLTCIMLKDEYGIKEQVTYDEVVRIIEKL
jgi:3-dehydroquinate synthase